MRYRGQHAMQKELGSKLWVEPHTKVSGTFSGHSEIIFLLNSCMGVAWSWGFGEVGTWVLKGMNNKSNMFYM